MDTTRAGLPKRRDMLRLLGAAVIVLIAIGLALGRVDWTTRPKKPAISTPMGLEVCLDPPATAIEWLQRRYEQFVLGHSWKTCK